MKNMTFGNFDYVMIDSVRSGYREVLVTYTANGRTFRKCIFVHEVKGKDTNYYFKEAQKQIEEGIKNGSLIKSTNKQNKKTRPHVLKPAIVALSIIVAIGGIGTGGYFLGNYFFGGNGGDVPPGPEPGVTHTVALIAGENAKFNNDKTYLILNNVPDGTALSDIEGYQLPTSTINYTFEKWNGPVETGPYPPSFKITEDITLFATFFQGITYLKSQAINDVANELKYLTDLYGEFLEQEVIDEALLPIYNKTVEVINTIEDTGDPSKIDDAKGTIESLREFAISVLDEACYAGFQKKEDAVTIYNYYKVSIDNIINEPNSAKRFAFSEFNKAYARTLNYMLSGDRLTLLDAAYDHYVETVKEVSPEEPYRDLIVRLWSYYGSALILGTKYFENESTLNENINKINEAFDTTLFNFKDAGIKAADTDTINWIGKTIRDYEYGKFKYSFDIDGYYNYIDLDTTIAEMESYLKEGSKNEGDLININLKAAVLNSLSETLVLDGIDHGGLPKFSNFNDVVIKCCGKVQTVVNTELMGYGENGIIYANKLVKCFTNLLEAFKTYHGLVSQENEDHFFKYEYLFKISESSTLGNVTVNDSIMQQVCGLFESSKANFLIRPNEALIDAFVTLTEEAIDIATLSSIGSYFLDYEDLFNLSNLTVNLAKQQTEQPQEFYQNVTPLLISIIDMSADSGLIPNDKDAMSVAINTFIDANSDVVTFLTNIYNGAFMSANIAYKRIIGSTEAYGDANDYIGVLIGKIDGMAKSSLMNLYRSKPAILNALGEMGKNIFVNNTNSILDAASIDEVEIKLAFMALSDYMFEPVNLIFNELGKTLEKGTYPDSVYLTCFDAYEELFTTIPKLGVGSGETFKGKLGRINQMIKELLKGSTTYFIKRLDKANELKKVIEVNFINVVNENMDDETFEATIQTTLSECKKIVEEK